MLYDRPVRELLEEAVSDMPAVFRGSDLVVRFKKQYPLVKETTVRTHISCATVNLPSRIHCHRDHDLLFKRPDGRLERYDIAVHGLWKNGQPIETDVDVGDREEEPGRPDVEEDRTVAQALSNYLAVDLPEGVLSLPGGLTHRFDFVGEGAAVGLHVDQEARATSGERWGATSEAVWLLQKLEEPGPRFVVFTRDRRLPLLWLGEFGRLCPDVEFLSVDGTKVTDLRDEA